MNRKVGIILIVVIVIILIIGLFRLNASLDEPKLSEEEIKEVILIQYPGEIKHLSFYGDTDDAYYQAEVVNGMDLYSLKLDSQTGEILEIEKETSQVNENQNQRVGEKPIEQEPPPSKDQQENHNEKKNAVLDVDKVREIALSQFSGEIVELELDEDDGRKIYEVQIKSGEEEAEIEMDAYTGEIIVIDIDQEDDDD